MNSQFTLTPATKPEMEKVAKVFKRSRLEALPYLPELHTEAEDIGFFTDVVFKKCEVVVAKDNETSKIIGFIAFNSEWIDHLYILPESQGKGVGASLLKMALEKSESLKLWSFQKNEKALKFYASHGFKEIKRTDGSENEEKEPDVLMQWSR